MLDNGRVRGYNAFCHYANALTGNSKQDVHLQRAAVAGSAVLNKLTELALERFR